MRKAIQRCAASLPPALASLPSSSLSSGRHFAVKNFASRHAVRPSRVLIRCISQSPFGRQEVAARAEAGESHSPVTRFDELETNNLVHTNVVRTITGDMGLETMTDVQTKTINEALRGDDIIAQAKTGTGKTLAFLIPVLQNIISVDPDLARPSNRRQGPRATADDIRAIIISPTRELAEQIAAEARKLVRNTGVIVQTAVGGTQKAAGLAAIQRQGCHILVGTPGRLKDILSDPYTRVEAPDLSALVFDEADRLLDQGFWVEIQEIMQQLPSPTEKERQTLMFSATVPEEVVGLVRETMRPGFQFVKCVGDNEDPTHGNVAQRVVTVNGFENALPALVELCSLQIDESKKPGNKPFKALVFFNSTAEVSLAANLLQNLQNSTNKAADDRPFGSGRAGHPWSPARILEIHAKLSQGQRTAAADSFRRAESAIMLSSDVTARGMDFPNVTHIIQVGLPTSRDQYIHRVGRTARAGKEGEAWLIINQFESDEARTRLRKLPLQKDTSLETGRLDLTKEAQVPANVGQLLSMYQNAMRRVPALDKSKVYRAQIGVFQWFNDKSLLVRKMNDLSKYGWGMPEPPRISPMLASRLRLPTAELNLGIDPEMDRQGPRQGGFGRGPRQDAFDRGSRPPRYNDRRGQNSGASNSWESFGRQGSYGSGQRGNSSYDRPQRRNDPFSF